MKCLVLNMSRTHGPWFMWREMAKLGVTYRIRKLMFTNYFTRYNSFPDLIRC